MYQFLVDAWTALRLKFYPITHYRYPLSIIIAILFTLGLINAASTPPLFIGSQVGLISFFITLTILRWLVLCLVMKVFLSPANSSPMQWCGYVLVTEALMMPLLALIYWPEIMVMPSFLWLSWIMLVQFVGFIQISKHKPGKIILAYIVYFLVAAIAGAILLSIFFSMNWLDMEASLKAMRQYLNIPDTVISPLL